MIESVVFDMDGVLFDTERLSRKAWNRAGTEMGIPDIDTAVIDCVGLNAADTRRYFRVHYGPRFPYDAFRARISQIFHEIIQTEGFPQKTGVTELLRFLESEHYRVALATSTSRVITLKYLARTGIVRYFQAIVTGDMIEHGKPDPGIYLLACEKLGSEPERCIAVEDSPNGILSAFRAGMKPVMVPDLIRPSDDIEKLLYAKCRDLLEVMAFLQKTDR